MTFFKFVHVFYTVLVCVWGGGGHIRSRVSPEMLPFHLLTSFHVVND